MRRLLPLLLTALVLAACSGDGDDAPAAQAPTSVAPEADLPPALDEFLDGVAEPGAAPFRATYHVLRKLGGGEAEVTVVADPVGWKLVTGDLLLVEGGTPATCRPSAQRCIEGVRQQLLQPVGVFTRFFATAPAQALATDARRETAGEPRFTERTVAGVALRCAAVPQQGVVISSYCLTPEGVFGWVDTPAVRYELTAYEPGPPGESTNVPYPLTADDSFLQQP